MASSTRHSGRTLAEAGAVLRDNRAGGRHRAGGGQPIGLGSARLRRRHRGRRLVFMFGAIFAVLVAAGVIGTIINGIGFPGVMLVLLAIALIIGITAFAPRVKVPARADLARTQDARTLVARTELWLEAQRPALPPPAVAVVEQLGVQLDALGAQLAHVDPAHPAAAETRQLVGEFLPEMIEAWQRIPAHLRREERAGSTPEAQLVESLTKISGEIDHVTRQLAEGDLDKLAIRTRYLDYKYPTGEGPA